MSKLIILRDGNVMVTSFILKFARDRPKIIHVYAALVSQLIQTLCFVLWYLRILYITLFLA